MASRFETRLRKLEALQVDGVDAILDELDGNQSEAILLHLMAIASGEDGLSDERLRQTPMNQARYNAVLASIPEGTAERLFAALMRRVEKTGARAA